LFENLFQGKKAIAKKHSTKQEVCPILTLSGNEKRKTGRAVAINGISSITVIPMACRKLSVPKLSGQSL
jgi:hypothetical protein